MSLYLQSFRPWDHGSPFGYFFRELINEGFEAVHRFVELEPELNRVISTPIEPPGEASAVEAHFDVIIQGTKSDGWPKLYDWFEYKIVGTGQGIVFNVLDGGKNSTDEDEDGNLLFGLGINRVEFIPGFGDTVGPYGQVLDSGGSVLTVLAVASGSPVEMILRTNDSGNTIPMFTAYNPMTVECTP